MAAPAVVLALNNNTAAMKMPYGAEDGHEEATQRRILHHGGI